jgi:hypothetical protein
MANEDGPVGYKRPPKSSQFKPGQSGNPTGRKKNVTNFKTDLIAELNETVPFRENGRERQFTKQRAFVKTLIDLAIKGDIRAINAIVALCRSFDADGGNASDEDIDNDGVNIMNDYLEGERRRSDHSPSNSEKERK